MRIDSRGHAADQVGIVTDIAVQDMIMPPDLPQVKVNKHLMALVQRKMVAKVPLLSIHRRSHLSGAQHFLRSNVSCPKVVADWQGGKAYYQWVGI
jgi:hypothetical protein